MCQISNKFSAPGMDDDARKIYTNAYGEAGVQFLYILSSSPDEIAVISRMLAYLKAKKEVA